MVMDNDSGYRVTHSSEPLSHPNLAGAPGFLTERTPSPTSESLRRQENAAWEARNFRDSKPIYVSLRSILCRIHTSPAITASVRQKKTSPPLR